MSNVVLIGEAPAGRGTQVEPALEGRVGRRLARMMELTYGEYLDGWRRVNIFETPDEGRVWRVGWARERGIQLRMTFGDGDLVVVLGEKVAQALLMPADAPYYHWVSYHELANDRTYHVAKVPHPSGRNRVLNDPAERRRMARFLKETMHDRNPVG